MIRFRPAAVAADTTQNFGGLWDRAGQRVLVMTFSLGDFVGHRHIMRFLVSGRTRFRRQIPIISPQGAYRARSHNLVPESQFIAVPLLQKVLCADDHLYLKTTSVYDTCLSPALRFEGLEARGWSKGLELYLTLSLAL
jgi:hypothetical protein